MNRTSLTPRERAPVTPYCTQTLLNRPYIRYRNNAAATQRKVRAAEIPGAVSLLLPNYHLCFALSTGWHTIGAGGEPLQQTLPLSLGHGLDSDQYSLPMVETHVCTLCKGGGLVRKEAGCHEYPQAHALCLLDAIELPHLANAHLPVHVRLALNDGDALVRILLTVYQ